MPRLFIDIPSVVIMKADASLPTPGGKLTALY
jgi:hypothetical protein